MGAAHTCLAVILIRKDITSDAHNAQYGPEINLCPRKWITTSRVLCKGGIMMLSAAAVLTCYRHDVLSHFSIPVLTDGGALKTITAMAAAKQVTAAA